MWFTLERWILGGPPVPGASLLLATSLVLLIVCTPSLQQQEQRGTQEIPETTFSCDGRVPGYYADPETGCQVYHMCEAGGRKFSYRCPEQTLFQQRMMVCDHWFMVDCKTSALHYAANLLLGDKTKLFIGAGETVQREFVHDAKAPRYRSDRLSFGNKKTSTRRVPVSQKNIKQNVSSTIEDIDSRTFPTTLFPFSSQTFHTIHENQSIHNIAQSTNDKIDIITYQIHHRTTNNENNTIQIPNDAKT
ncbi:hypothetical protein B566_EDAN013438 [Ephemera danica]|nr:hypothetical protein B566_EDAN013438 [Ephemera danica]